MKEIEVGKEVTLPFCVNNRISHVKSLKKCSRNLLGLIHELSKDERYKVSVNVNCIYTQ